MNEEDDKPITKRRLDIELERFHTRLRTEEQERKQLRNHNIQMALMCLMALTIYFLLLMRLLEWKLGK